MKMWLDTDLCSIIVPDTYGSEFQYYAEDWGGLITCMTYKAEEYILQALKETEHFKDATIKMGEFHSPREYNFVTDWIDFEIEFSDDILDKIRNIDDDDFFYYISTTFASHSGFVSFMPTTKEEYIVAINSKDSTRFARALSEIILYEVQKEYDLNMYGQEYLEEVSDYCFGNGILSYDEGGI